MSTISSEYFGHMSNRYSAKQSGKYKGFGVVDFEKGTVGDNYEPYPMSSGQMTGGSAVPSSFVRPAGKIYKFMQPKVTMPTMHLRREPAYPTMLAPTPKKSSTHKRKSTGKRSGHKRQTKKSTGRR